MRRLTASLLTLVLAATAGCGQAAQSQPMASPAASDEAMTLSSPAVADGKLLTAYRCEPKVNGVEASLPLAWTGTPFGAASLAVTMTHHPDASDPAIVSSYLLLWAIPPTARGIPAGAADDGPWLLGANKDGVARGRTRFNLRGIDLNRGWDQPASPELCPENHALEQWLAAMAARNLRPHLALELHNDNNGKLHVSRPAVPDLAAYLESMKRLESLLRQHTWFTEGSTGATTRNPGTLGDGWLERFGIPAAVLEFNAHWIAGKQKAPLGADWQEFGRALPTVFAAYFALRPGSP